MAVVYNNGSIYQFSLQEKMCRGLLFKLPKSDKYHGYSNDKGILYFIDGKLSKVKNRVTKYHKSFGHSSVPINCKFCEKQANHMAENDDKLWLEVRILE